MQVYLDELMTVMLLRVLKKTSACVHVSLIVTHHVCLDHAPRASSFSTSRKFGHSFSTSRYSGTHFEFQIF